MTNDERLQGLIDNGLQAEGDYKFVEKQAAKYGITICRSNCRDRYRDAAIAVLCKIRHAQYSKNKERKYILRAGVDVVWQGARINNTCSDEQLAEYLTGGFPRDFFERIAQPTNKQNNEDNKPNPIS